MPAQPTIIVTSCHHRAGQGEVVGKLDRSWELARALTACRLPVVLVTSETRLQPATLGHGQHFNVCVVRPHAVRSLDQHIEALIEGVLLSARSAGWVWVPADTPMLRHETVMAVADKLGHASLTHAEHDQRAGIPLGIGPELYSELIHLNGYSDLLRLRSRYPALAVPTQDPGVLMSAVGGLTPAFPVVDAGRSLGRASR